MSRTHLHGDDHPATLKLLAEVLDAKHVGSAKVSEVGYEPTTTGAWVDWDLLEASGLSTSERGIVTIARGCATLEVHGGTMPHSEAVITTVSTVMGRSGPVDDDQPRWLLLLRPSTCTRSRRHSTISSP